MPRPSHNAYAYAFGDVPAVPSELRLPGVKAGEGRARPESRCTSYDIAHRDSVNNR